MFIMLLLNHHSKHINFSKSQCILRQQHIFYSITIEKYGTVISILIIHIDVNVPYFSIVLKRNTKESFVVYVICIWNYIRTSFGTVVVFFKMS